MSIRKASPATTQDLDLLEVRLKEEITASEKRIMQHFDLAIETIQHDLRGANSDEIELIKDDIIRLRDHTGLLPA